MVDIHFAFTHKFVCHLLVHQLQGDERNLSTIHNLVYLFEEVSVKGDIIGI